jgi:Trk-type K+ transport system membrane component
LSVDRLDYLSIITTTSFSSADFTLWLVPAQVTLLTVVFVGGCGGSAGDGIKVALILFAGKILKREVGQPPPLTGTAARENRPDDGTGTY